MTSTRPPPTSRPAFCALCSRTSWNRRSERSPTWASSARSEGRDWVVERSGSVEEGFGLGETEERPKEPGPHWWLVLQR